jgi:cholesterol 25-hydroxylase
LYNWSTFETIWTVFLYAAIEAPMTVVFMKHPEWRFVQPPASKSGKPARTKPRGMRRPSRRLGEISLYVAPLLAMDLTMIKKFADVEIEDILTSGGYESRIFTADGTTSHPPKTFLVPTLHNFTPSSPLQLTRALPTSPPTSRRLVFELISSFIIYDFLFFLFHLSLHKLPILKTFHTKHHAHDAQLNPQVTNQLSIVERLGLILLANFSLNIIGSHVLTRTVFVPVFVWLLVEIHCGMDVPWGYEKILPKGWGGGARKHMRHHNVGEKGFEPFFCWWDGFWEWAAGDWGA